MEGTARDGSGRVKVSWAGRGCRWGRGPVGLASSDETPDTVAHVGPLSPWKGLRSPSLPRTWCQGPALSSCLQVRAQITAGGRTRRVSASGQPHLPSRSLSRALESLKGPSGHGELGVQSLQWGRVSWFHPSYRLCCLLVSPTLSCMDDFPSLPLCSPRTPDQCCKDLETKCGCPVASSAPR
ncbi:hypothetical protein HJG60_009284 [Phyllostomus discolor]|uniref:Uncharacterized protein n=1 Tax=Phyllostomus discolor TaxID=89673 RepID=A0A834DG04_9CHIR|nr:hypothetical protein HJG60_009284 [Phyllostomus discolor]